MSLPQAVFLDTNVLDRETYNFTSTALTSFIPQAAKHGLKLLLPAPTEGEILRHIKERSQDALKALMEARRHAPFLAKWKHFPSKNACEHSNWQVAQVAKSEWTDFLRNFDVVKLDYSEVNVKEIMQWYEAITPPFGDGKKRKEFPDAFAVAIVQSYAKRTKESVAVVSDDNDIKLACKRFPSLLHFKSLPSLTELLLCDETELSDLRRAILNDLTELEKSIRNELACFGGYHVNPGINVTASELFSIEFQDVRIVALGTTECTLTFEGEVEARHLLQWQEWYRDRDDYEVEQKWVSEPVPFNGTAKVTLDPKANRLIEVSFIDLDFTEILVTLDPIRY